MPRDARGPFDEGVSEVLSTSLLLGLTVAMLSVFAFLILNIPPPTAEPHADLQAFVLPRDPQTVVIEHRGGASIPLMDARIRLLVGSTEVAPLLGERILAADPQWTVLGADGVPKAATDRFETGDRVLYTAASVPGSRIEVFLADEDKDAPVLDAAVIQLADSFAPQFVSARTVTTTAIEVTLTEPLYTLSVGDFAFSDGIVASDAEIISNGSVVRFTTSAFPADATPTIWTIATPYASADYAGIDVTAADAVVATDGVAPTISAVSPGAPSETTTTVTWTTDETSTSVVRYGPSSSLGRTSLGLDGTSHAVTIGPLSELTLYYYLVESTDPAGNTAQSSIQTFITDDDLLGVENLTINVYGGDSLDVVTAPVVAGVVTTGFSVGLFDPDGNPKPATIDIVVHLQSNRTTGRFFDAAGVAEVQTVTIPGGSAVAAFRYYDTLAGPASMAVAAERLVGDADAFLVSPGPHAAWGVAPSGTAAAGDILDVIISATDAFGNRVTTYAASPSFTFAGAGHAPDGSPKGGVGSADTLFGGTTGPFTFAAGTAPAKLQLFKAETAHVMVTDTTVGFSSGAAPAEIVVTAGPLAALRIEPSGQSIASGVWAGPFRVVALDQYGNEVVQSADRAITLTTAGGDLSDVPAGVPTTDFTIPAGNSYVEFYAKYLASGMKTITASTTSPAVSTDGTVYVAAFGTGHYFQLSDVPASLVSSVASDPITVTLMSPDGFPATATAPITVVFTTNSTRGHFRADDDSTEITRLVIDTGESSATFRYIDQRKDRATTVIAVFATNVIPDAADIFIIGRGGTGGGLLEDRIHAYLIHPSLQLKNQAGRHIGMTIMNPTANAAEVDRVIFAMDPTLGSYFNNVVVAPGSSPGWAGCTITFTNGANTVFCDPSAPVALPPYSLTQVILTYRTPNLDGQSVLTGTAEFVSGSAPVDDTVNVRVTGSGSLEIHPLTGGAGTDPRAAMPDMNPDAVNTFYIRFKFNQGSGNVITRLYFPQGWSELRVPAQAVLQDITVGIRQPGFDQAGFILFSQTYNTNAVRDVRIEVKAPNIDGLDALPMEVTDTDGNYVAVQTFGVDVE